MRMIRLHVVLKFWAVLLLSGWAYVSQACTIDSYSVVNPDCFYSSNGSLTINASGAPSLTYSIDGGLTFSASNVFSNLSPGTYIVVVQSPLPCSVSDTIVISPNSILSADLLVSATTVFVGEDVLFTDASVGHTGSLLDYGDGTASGGITSIIHNYNLAGNYSASLVVTDGLCSDTAFANVVVLSSSSLTIPNVFSPNEDGVNDLFMPQVMGIKELECTIMNRYGEIVQAWNGPRGFWDGYTFPAGVACPTGTYFYWIKAVGYDGVNYEQKGTITLLR